MDSRLTVLRYLRGLPIASPNLLCTPTTYHMIPPASTRSHTGLLFSVSHQSLLPIDYARACQERLNTASRRLSGHASTERAAFRLTSQVFLYSHSVPCERSRVYLQHSDYFWHLLLTQVRSRSTDNYLRGFYGYSSLFRS